jgi:hypothetical protein
MSALLVGQVAAADPDRFDGAFEEAQQIRGQVSIWGQGLLHSHVLDDDIGCGAEEDFCEDVLGFGAFGSFQLPLASNVSAIADLTVDYHDESDEDGSHDQPALYVGSGLHLVYENGDMPLGIFGVLAKGKNNADSDDIGVIGGAGVEIGYYGGFAQAGFLTHITDEAKVDTIDQLYFLRIGAGFDLSHGRINGSVAGGTGDFDDDADEDIPSLWLQFAAEYEAPLGDSGLNWFVGYQGDFLQMGESGDVDQALMHTGIIGLRAPFGAGAPLFSTPNFRGPIAYSGELNN